MIWFCSSKRLSSSRSATSRIRPWNSRSSTATPRRRQYCQSAGKRNSCKENGQIEAGEEPEGWSKAKGRQKDGGARWTRKNSKSYFGYKNQLGADVKHKLIGKYQVSSAEVHDSQVFEELLRANSGRDLWADSACRSAERLLWLDRHG